MLIHGFEMRVCTTCKQEKVLEDFHKKAYRCKPCAVEAAVAWGRKNRERKRKNTKEAQKRYIKRNPGKRSANEARRYARERRATVKWASLGIIRDIYKMVRCLNAWEGCQKWTVGHEVPLAGRNVCGLHVESNLIIELAETNLSKGNRF